MGLQYFVEMVFTGCEEVRNQWDDEMEDTTMVQWESSPLTSHIFCDCNPRFLLEVALSVRIQLSSMC